MLISVSVFGSFGDSVIVTKAMEDRNTKRGSALRGDPRTWRGLRHLIGLCTAFRKLLLRG